LPAALVPRRGGEREGEGIIIGYSFTSDAVDILLLGELGVFLQEACD